ncbi:MAG: DUF2760 domain-containing protein [Desulfococcaceae bacterium]
MNLVKAYSGRALFWVFFFMAVLCALVVGALHVALDAAGRRLAALEAAATPELAERLAALSGPLDLIRQFYLPVSIGVFLIAALLLWLCLRLSLARLLKREPAESPKKSPERPKPPKSSAEEAEARRKTDQRLFLHLFSALQREGRLMDFFSEDLDDYDDDQIGAAVRTIHENCVKAIKQYVEPGPVLAAEEESQFTVAPGFDPNAIRLTGNVTGEPPFTGVVRHRGWKARKIELPTLSGDRDPAIIAPAEVEVL